MIVKTKLKIDLQRPGQKNMIYAMQNDQNTRIVEISLFSGGVAWHIPDGTTFAVGYEKADGTSGIYDTLPDGKTKAVTFEGNVITAILAPQVLTSFGDVPVGVALFDSNLNRLGVFPFVVRVEEDPSAGSTESEDYYWLSTLAAIGNMDDLETKDKSSLVAAINEVAQSGGGGGSGSSMELPCHISYNLVNAVSNNYVSTVNKGDDFEVSLTALEGYAFTSVKIIHNGETVVDEAYNTPITGYDWGIYGENSGVQGDIVVIAVAEQISVSGVTTSVEPMEDDIPKVFFGGALQQTKDEAVVPFRYISKTQDISGYAEIKAQGNSSMSYPKKNQTVKLFKDADRTEKMKVDFKGWGKQNKHCYKANWIDLTHARNVVSARIWGDVVKSRANYAELPELYRTSPNHGAVDGFPVKVYAAGVYQGRYTINIPKDKWMANMDDELDTHCILCGEGYVSGCFREASVSQWTDEIHDSMPSAIETRWIEGINFVMNSTDEEFTAGLSDYFDVPSLIDYHLYGLASCGLDAYGKNQIYMTYDAQKWIANMYDMDSTWGLYYNGSKFVATNYGRDEYEDMISNRKGNLLYIRLEQLFCEELQTRWAELKSGALSIENIINHFERFTDIAPAELVKEDYASSTGGGAFTAIPSQTTNNIQQIRAFALARQAWTDEYIANLGVVKYAVSYELTNATSDNGAISVAGNSSYTTTISAVTGATIDSVVVTMGGVDVTDEVYADGAITIATVTGDIVITVVASVAISDESLAYSLTETTTLNGTNCIDTGVCVNAENADYTITIDIDIDSSQNGGYVIFTDNTSNATSTNGVLFSASSETATARIYAYNSTQYMLGYSAGISAGKSLKMVLTRDSASGTTTAEFTVDGTRKNASPNTTAWTSSNTNNIVVGGVLGSDGAVTSGVIGTLNDFRIYNRVLASDEIEAYLD